MDKPDELMQSDEELMAQVRAGDLRKLAILFERHHRALYNFFRHMTGDRDLSQDLVQEVFFKMLRYRRSYDDKRRYIPWMYQIARNTGADHAQRKSFTGIPAEESVCIGPGIEETLRRRQQIGLLEKALERLPRDKREILILSRFQNLSHEAIALVIGCETATVKVRIYRAIRALSEIYFDLSGARSARRAQ